MKTATRITFAIILALAATIAPEGRATGGDAASAFAEGNRLLAAADFPGALRSYETAAKAAPQNQEYAQQFALVRRVIQLRGLLPQENDAQKWERMARGLRSFYHWNGVHTEALALDTEMHGRLKSAETAGMLAESQLALGMNAEAEALLKGHISDSDPVQNRALYAIALARQGNRKEARKIASTIRMPDAPNGPLHILMARLHALDDRNKDAERHLTLAMEQTIPTMLPAMRAHAEACPDFSGFSRQPQFAQALATQSKVQHSSCSDASSCGGCPSASSCGKSSGTAAKGK